jgi:hypothetical protein
MQALDEGQGEAPMNETMNQIQALANERQMLYRLAGKGHLNETQLNRLQSLEGQLALLWDQYRREFAGSKPVIPYAERYNQAA